MDAIPGLFRSGGNALLAAAAGSAATFGATAPAPSAPAAVVALAEAAPQARITRARDGLFYLDGTVNGARVRFLIDTGASVTVLTPRDAARAGVSVGRGAARMRTASGHGAMRWARVGRLGVGGQEVRDLDAAVVAAVPVSLLGQNALTRLGSVRIAGNEMHLG